MRTIVRTVLILMLAGSLATPGFAARRGQNVTVRTEHSDDPKEVAGQVTAVDLGKNQIVVNSQKFDAPRSTKITVNGTPGLFMHIKVGDQVRVSYTVHTSTTIRSTGRSKSGSRSSKSTNTGGKDQSIEADSLTVTR
ncbi:MAG: hypothetical protein PCFJNLEI_01194 [Verrucomicrobiae bacterium]|nr:hypothetical protein [Verrucomicrobiae bacterium]